MENKKIKTVTSIALSKEAEGIRVIYRFSELEQDGTLISQSNVGNVYIMEEDMKEPINVLYKYLNEKINKEDSKN